MISTGIKRILVLTAVTLPIVTVVVFSAGNLLAAMGDTSGQGVLERIAQGSLLLWTIDLVLLVLAMGCEWLEPSSGSDHRHGLRAEARHLCDSEPCAELKSPDEVGD